MVESGKSTLTDDAALLQSRQEAVENFERALVRALATDVSAEAIMDIVARQCIRDAKGPVVKVTYEMVVHDKVPEETADQERSKPGGPRDARRSGEDGEDLDDISVEAQVVSGGLKRHYSLKPVAPVLPARSTLECPADVVYEPGRLPDGLIDLPSASRSKEEGGYGIAIGTLRTWVQRGFIKQKGRMRGAAPGGYIVISVKDLEARIACPRKKGRPRLKMR